MMGQHPRSESLFYYFRIEEQVPENHLLRLIDRHVSFEFVREKLRDSYSEIDRPSKCMRSTSKNLSLAGTQAVVIEFKRLARRRGFRIASV